MSGTPWSILRNLRWFVGLVMLVVVSECDAQTFPSREVRVRVDSGEIRNVNKRAEVVWQQVVQVKGATWVRLWFDRLVLSHDLMTNQGATLRITSLLDGHVQLLNAESALQWGNSSAYFNGPAVRLELLALPDGRLNRIRVGHVDAGLTPLLPPPRSICDIDDNRQLSNDPRVGRTVPGGCTAWLFNDRNHCVLTAGHCASSTSVVEFNVPLSTAGGSYQHPGPEDQYPVDATSMQFINGGVGNDWCYFGCFDNSNTGLSPFEAQGDSFQLVLPQPVSGGDTIRITGHGTTSSPVDPRWNGAQKTHTGPYASFSGSRLQYRTDTTGGNSGSPVIFENDGTTIGIHTHGGCSSGGSGANSGTGANNAGFQAALANPLGICRAAIEFDLPNGRPALIDPAGGDAIRVVVSDDGIAPQPGTGLLHVDSGSGFQTVPMTVVSANVYDAVFPPTPCGRIVSYYFSVESNDGGVFVYPADAPDTVFTAISAKALTTVYYDDFESNSGWSVSGDAVDGQWQRGVPAGGGDRGDPAADADGSGACYVTDNADGNSDVDDGSTFLVSPQLDATVASGEEAVLSYYRWYNNVAGNAPQADVFTVEISDNNGATWETVETVGPTGVEVTGGWYQQYVLISDYVTPNSQFRVRFTASDLAEPSVVEAGVDGVALHIIECSSVVPAASSKLLDGVATGGGLGDTGESDNVYWELDPSPTTNPIKQRIDLIIQNELDPGLTSLALRVEAKKLGGPVGDVEMEVRLFNWQTSQYETFHSGPVQNTDTPIVAIATGDVSRFVVPGLGEVTGNIVLKSETFSGAPFTWSAEIDEVVWLVD